MQGQSVDLSEQLVERQAVGARRAAGNLPGQHPHTKGLGQAGHGTTKFTLAQQAEGFAFKLHDREVQQAKLLGLLPGALADGFLIVGDAGRQRQQ